MKTYQLKIRFTLLAASALMIFVHSCMPRKDASHIYNRFDQQETVVLETSFPGGGKALSVYFKAGRSFNHPLMAIWVEDLDSNYVQTLYVAQSIAEGIFRHGDPSTGRWQPGPVRRPAALPYWGHQRGIPASDGLYMPTQDNPMPDALTGATPKGNFVLHTHIPDNKYSRFRLLFEINQSWDWNQYWHNNKFPDDKNYMTSSQPAVVYEALIDLESDQKEYLLRPIGHSHWSGQTGELFPDLHTLTTALNIAREIIVRIE